MTSRKANTAQAARELAATLDDALALLADFKQPQSNPAPVDNPPALLEQCLSLCEEHTTAKREPIRTIHHFACTGGTLICKCIAALPNTQLLSEVNPFSQFDRQQDPVFAPTDMIRLMQQSTASIEQDTIADLFIASLQTIHAKTTSLGQRLVLRDHTHGHYCVGNNVSDAPIFKDLVAEHFPTRSIVTVRHPLDSYLSLCAQQWLHFSPATLDEYCKRYIAFLDEYAGTPMIRYEDFVASPQTTMQKICTGLELAYTSEFTELFDVFRLSGDSGRRSDTIQTKPRRPVPAEVSEALSRSNRYAALLDKLSYH